MKEIEPHDLPFKLWVVAKQMLNKRNWYRSSGHYSFTIEEWMSEITKADLMTEEIRCGFMALILSRKDNEEV